MNRGRRFTRRQFLRHGSAFLAAAPAIIPSLAFTAEKNKSPSSRIAVGAIGTGGMGKADIESFLWIDGVQVVAVCDVDGKRREEARALVEKHYTDHKDKGSFRGCDKHSDFRQLLARPDIDAVIIATPDHWHVPIAVAAAKAGKDIYCEKPLSLTVSQGRALCETAKRYGTIFQTGTQQRSDARFRQACELVRNGRIGRLTDIKTVLVPGKSSGLKPAMPVPDYFDYDMWLGPAPWEPYTEDRCHWNFRYNLDYSGGTLTDWGAHHNDIAQWGNGTEYSGPCEVEGTGEFPKDGLFNAAVKFDLRYRYSNGVKLQCVSNGSCGVTFRGTEGRIFVSRSKIEAEPKSLLKSRIGPDEIHLYESKWHQQNFIDCVRSRRETISPPEIAHRSVTVCHIGNISMLLKRKLFWDPERELFLNDPEANRMLSRPMRGPWRT